MRLGTSISIYLTKVPKRSTKATGTHKHFPAVDVRNFFSTERYISRCKRGKKYDRGSLNGLGSYWWGPTLLYASPSLKSENTCQFRDVPHRAYLHRMQASGGGGGHVCRILPHTCVSVLFHLLRALGSYATPKV